MQVAARPHVTAGIALAGAAVIAASPIAPTLPDIHLPNQHDVQAAAVRLTAGWDPLAAWQNAFTTASGNASTIANNFLLAPGVGLQQAIVNEVGFLKEVINDPSSIGTVLQQIATNAQTVASGLTGVGASAATNKAAQAHSVDALHGALLSLLPTMLPAGVDPATVTQVLDVLSSPASGLLIGAVGPVISPGVALLNSALAVGAALQASDPSAALSDLLNVPANMVNGFFNGADLNLDALVPLIAQSGLLPAGTTINALDFAFGGLLSVGSVSQGTYTQNGTITPITTPGGSILNSLGLNVTTVLGTTPVTLNIASHAVGPLGALESISQTVGVLLGDHWDGKHAVQTPPLSTLSDTTADTAVTNTAVPAVTKAATAVNAAAVNDTTAVNALTSPTTKNAMLKVTSPVKETATAENASASTELVGLPKLHVPVTAPRTVPAGTTGSGAAATDATATGTGGAAVPVKGGSTSGKHAIANNPVRAGISNVSEGITKAVSGGTGKSNASAGSSKGSGGGGRHRK
jgi:hypothetical protein